MQSRSPDPRACNSRLSCLTLARNKSRFYFTYFTCQWRLRYWRMDSYQQATLSFFGCRISQEIETFEIILRLLTRILIENFGSDMVDETKWSTSNFSIDIGIFLIVIIRIKILGQSGTRVRFKTRSSLMVIQHELAGWSSLKCLPAES